MNDDGDKMPIYGYAGWPDYKHGWFSFNEDNDIVRIFEVINNLTEKAPEKRPANGNALYDPIYYSIVY